MVQLRKKSKTWCRMNFMGIISSISILWQPVPNQSLPQMGNWAQAASFRQLRLPQLHFLLQWEDRYTADKSNLRKEGLVCLPIPGYGPSLCRKQSGRDLLLSFPWHSQSGAESNDSGIQACLCSLQFPTHKHQVLLPRKWRPSSGWAFPFQLI